MKNLRTYKMTRAEQEDFDPGAFTEKLKAAGFKFDSERCPVKLSEPWSRFTEPDGTVFWKQWDEGETT